MNFFAKGKKVDTLLIIAFFLFVFTEPVYKGIKNIREASELNSTVLGNNHRLLIESSKKYLKINCHFSGDDIYHLPQIIEENEKSNVYELLRSNLRSGKYRYKCYLKKGDDSYIIKIVDFEIKGDAL